MELNKACLLQLYYTKSKKLITLKIRWFGWAKIYALVQSNSPDVSLKQLVNITVKFKDGSELKETKLYSPKWKNL